MNLSARKIIAYVLLGILWAQAAWSGQTAADSLEKKLAYIHTLQADFSQTVVSGERISQRLSGTFRLKKPGKFFWQTKKPIHQEIVSDGKKVWFYDKDLEQVTITSLQRNVGVTPALLLNGKSGTVSRDYAVKWMPVDEKLQTSIYTLTPKDKRLYQYIQLFFEKEYLKRMRFKDNLGQYTDFYFTHIKINQPLSDTGFVFVRPSGVDVVYG